MSPIIIPPEWKAFTDFLMNPATMGLLLTWFLGHVSFMKNPDRDNLLKFLVAVVACLLWSFLVAVDRLQGVPQTPTDWYSVFYLGVSIVFSNQLAYGIIDNIPALKAFLVTVFGKTVSTTATNTDTTATVDIKTETSAPAEKPPDTPKQASQTPALAAGQG